MKSVEGKITIQEAFKIRIKGWRGVTVEITDYDGKVTTKHVRSNDTLVLDVEVHIV